MDVKQAIEDRRSIRKYQDRPVPQELIDEVLNAARLAPSGNNTQPWRYKVITDDETKRELQDAGLIRDQFVYKAPVIIVCCADPTSYKKHVEGWDDDNKSRAARDLNIASSYITLQATALGLGTCYCGWIKEEGLKVTLGIPEHLIVPYVITLGYPDEDPKARPRKDLVDILL